MLPFGDPATGGASRARTDDLLLAKQVLSQLSYGPVRLDMVGLGGFEPPTSPLSGVRSDQLSYRPEVDRVRNRATPATRYRASLCGHSRPWRMQSLERR